MGLSFRVRNGTGRFPHAMTAVTPLPDPPLCVGVGNLVVTTIVVLLFSYRFSANGFVGWEPHSGRKHALFLCGVSYRPISTGQLHESLVLASTSGLSTQWSGWGPLTPEGVWKSHLEASFPLRCFQRLSHPNVANQRCTWQYN